MTSVSESGPLVLIEYLAQNLPFLSYNTGEVSKIIKDENSSFVIDTFIEKDWIESIAEIKKKNDFNLNAIYDKHFSSKKYLNTCIDIYNKIMTLK
jgi:glycosyltransferase involved in cell wall biosynthesis